MVDHVPPEYSFSCWKAASTRIIANGIEVHGSLNARHDPGKKCDGAARRPRWRGPRAAPSVEIRFDFSLASMFACDNLSQIIQ
ncbi:hypothetical protein [Noviherbaspirillum pedocola]|uniref:Uncharacterized protein n=1 Tax=Noviherbaspirillum pedocola TaxID=2801341 RepID=A0A934SQI5_9BURK|nr:hypothetical protein [Noviherbaspirillum pedocola]MBK4733443.1 hypothetical protein [Noviherbaspirillum pedocola]